MKKIAAFFRLVRWPNLLFIALTQYLFFYALLNPLFGREDVNNNLDFFHLTLLVISSVFIAAAGNIINDYFDLNIDVVNKPDKVIIGKYIHRHWAIACHVVLSTLAVFIGFYLDYKAGTFMLGITNMICVTLLFIYSMVLKRKVLWGNVLVSLLTAWTVAVITFSETKALVAGFSSDNISSITRITVLYCCFAFIISLIREMIKDMEDMEGDRKYGCTTFPIVFGFPATKVFIYVWLLIIIGLLIFLLFYILPFMWWLAMAYIIIFILSPLANITLKLGQAANPADFHKLSSLVKVVMLTGICSMIFFWYYS